MVDPEEVFDLLADDYASDILLEANRKPMTAQELSDALGVHHSTVYRRLERLQTHNLLSEQLRIDPGGHHATVYRTNLRQLTVMLDDDGYQVQLRLEEDPIDRMADMWQQIRGETP